ncbi:MAG: TRAP transporter large permease subunit [Candidatus Marinimicrobia bacterium]|nr:TRAP transporter large permease subunit [Candidatus Neomarinimicrobiota bacterium]
MIPLIIFLLLLIILGLPLFAAVGGITLSFFAKDGINPTVVIAELYRLASAPTLMAIPLFTLAGYTLAESKAPKRLFDLIDAVIGFLPGGIAIVALVIMAVFTCFTGASGITIIALGGLLYPILRNQEYSDEFTTGLITCSGSLGLLFPPSLPLILYGIIAQVQIDHLFIAGIIPGILLILLLSIFSVRKDVNARIDFSKFSFSKLKSSVKNAAWEIPIPIIILGGIYSGLMTVVEASALTAFYVIIVQFFIKKDLSVKKHTLKIFADSTRLIGGILIILAASMGFTAYLIDAQVPQIALEFIQANISSKFAFLFLLNIFLLITGAVLDIFSAIIIVVPLIVPISQVYGIDPLHLGIIFLANLEIGYMTPPVGMNLFISSFRFKKSIISLYRMSLPFLIILLLGLFLITYIPQISLFLVDWVF